jgi:hypothetical protein
VKRFRLILPLLVWLPVSCASHSKKPAEFKPLSQRMNEKGGFKQDSSGKWVAQSDKRSQFESKGESVYFHGDYAKKSYQPQAKGENYDKKAWWGNKDFALKNYTGNTDGSRFQKASNLDGKGARESGKAKDNLPGPYATKGFATKDAREASHKGIDKPTDVQTEDRQKVTPQPDVIDWREQRTLSLEQSKGLLGH